MKTYMAEDHSREVLSRVRVCENCAGGGILPCAQDDCYSPTGTPEPKDDCSSCRGTGVKDADESGCVCYKCKGVGFEVIVVPDSLDAFNVASIWGPTLPYTKEEIQTRVAWVKAALPKIIEWQESEGPIKLECEVCSKKFESHYAALRHTPSCEEFTKQKDRHGGFDVWPNNPFLTDKKEDWDRFFALVEDTLGADVMATLESRGKVPFKRMFVE